MLFNQKEFEHKISEEKLKAGLKLFVNNKVEFLNKSVSGDHIFLVRAQVPAEISIRKKGEKILSYTCSCNKNFLCEHLAAVLFYLQEETLGFSKKQKVQKTQSKASGKKRNEFENYKKQIKQIIKPFLAAQKLSEKNISQVFKSIDHEKTKASTFGHDIYFDLAVVLLLPQLINSNSNNALTLLTNNSKTNLAVAYDQGLSAKETEAWSLAAENSLRSQTYFRTGIFYFLIQKLIPFLKEAKAVEKLLTLLKKRKENKNSLSPISKKVIIEIELSITLATILEKNYSYKKFESGLELPIALAEIEFGKKKNLQGFKILDLYAGKIKSKNIHLYLDLIDHILLKAKEKKDPEYEKKYLFEKFVYGYYIDQNDLNNYFKIIQTENVEGETNKLVQQIKANSVFYTFDKIADVLIFQNRLNELIQEIKKEKNKFTLLNKIALLQLPEQNEAFLQLYVKHLSQAITEAKFPYFQEEIFNKAKNYLDKLPFETRKKMLEGLKEKLMYDKGILEYIDKMYPNMSV